ncbi:signal peptidase I [Clostridium sp. Marseille-P299]|uniref:signal peptidase I n=1 Tax=Clostridium sp. Marseille-P299 TaxID=1805477 RepID=UPI00083271FA|nr:signal peptidase I [Clostridium sp. Marseille-P299]
MNNESNLEEKETEKSSIRQVLETVLYFVVVLTVVLLVERFVMQPVEVDGSSMETTLSNKNHLLLEKLTYIFSEPERFDIIVFQPFEDIDDLYYIKRIIGLPGETVYINNNIIYINGEPLMENYGNENVINDPGIASEEIVLGDDEYFVMGDNRNHSKDSRDETVGLVTKKSIVGRAWCRVWPLKEIGVIRHQ